MKDFDFGILLIFVALFGIGYYFGKKNIKF